MWRVRVGKVPVGPSRAMHGAVLRCGQHCVLDPKKRGQIYFGQYGVASSMGPRGYFERSALA
jgi:hypothetical protein